MLRILGRTTLVSQFMVRSEWRSNRPWNIWPCLGYPASRRGLSRARNCGLFHGLLRAPDALRQGGDEIGHRTDRFGRRTAVGIETAAQGVDQRGPDHRAVGSLRDGAGGIPRADAVGHTKPAIFMSRDVRRP